MYTSYDCFSNPDRNWGRDSEDDYLQRPRPPTEGQRQRQKKYDPSKHYREYDWVGVTTPQDDFSPVRSTYDNDRNSLYRFWANRLWQNDYSSRQQYGYYRLSLPRMILIHMGPRHGAHGAMYCWALLGQIKYHGHFDSSSMGKSTHNNVLPLQKAEVYLTDQWEFDTSKNSCSSFDDHPDLQRLRQTVLQNGLTALAAIMRGLRFRHLRAY
jgi:hypothetical protein